MTNSSQLAHHTTYGSLVRSESLQASSAILQQNIRSIQDLTTENADLFQRIVIHPSTNFPGRTQEHVLLQLLRKKLEPDVESWVEEARETARAAGVDPNKLAAGLRIPGGGRGGGQGGFGGGGDGYDSEEDVYGLGPEDEVPSDPFNEQWADMLDAFQASLTEYVTVQVKKKYTVEEQAMGVENVRTGLRRDLEESDEEEEDEEEEDEEDEEYEEVSEAAAAQQGAGAPLTRAGVAAAAGGKLPLQPEHLFWLSVKGDLNLPPNVEFESRRKVQQKTKRPAPPR